MAKTSVVTSSQSPRIVLPGSLGREADRHA